MKDDNSDLFNLYVNLFNIVKKIRTGLEITLVHSQEKLALLDNYHFDIEEAYDYLCSNIDGFKEKRIKKDTFSILHNYVKNFLHPVNDRMSVSHDDDDEDTDVVNDTDGDEELDNIFSNIKSQSKKNKKLIFEQVVTLNSNGKKRTLKTPGEKGAFLIKIEITDTKDLKGVNNSDRWMKAAYRAIFLVDSKKNPDYISTRKVVLNTLKNLSKHKDVIKS